MERPSSDDLQTSIFGGDQANLDVLVVIRSPLQGLEGILKAGDYKTYNVEGKVVGVATGKEEVLAVERELFAISGNETSRHRGHKSACECSSKSSDGSALHDKYRQVRELRLSSRLSKSC